MVVNAAHVRTSAARLASIRFQRHECIFVASVCVYARERRDGERENAGRARETRARRVDEGATRRVTRTAELRCRVWDILKNRCDFHTIPPDACVVDAPCVSPKCRAENQRDGGAPLRSEQRHLWDERDAKFATDLARTGLSSPS